MLATVIVFGLAFGLLLVVAKLIDSYATGGAGSARRCQAKSAPQQPATVASDTMLGEIILCRLAGQLVSRLPMLRVSMLTDRSGTQPCIRYKVWPLSSVPSWSNAQSIVDSLSFRLDKQSEACQVDFVYDDKLDDNADGVTVISHYSKPN